MQRARLMALKREAGAGALLRWSGGRQRVIEGGRHNQNGLADWGRLYLHVFLYDFVCNMAGVFRETVVSPKRNFPASFLYVADQELLIL